MPVRLYRDTALDFQSFDELRANATQEHTSQGDLAQLVNSVMTPPGGKSTASRQTKNKKGTAINKPGTSIMTQSVADNGIVPQNVPQTTGLTSNSGKSKQKIIGIVPVEMIDPDDNRKTLIWKRHRSINLNQTIEIIIEHARRMLLACSRKDQRQGLLTSIRRTGDTTGESALAVITLSRTILDMIFQRPKAQVIRIKNITTLMTKMKYFHKTRTKGTHI